MHQAWRMVHKKWVGSAFSGEGARIAGGRWNSEGFPVVYTAGSLSLALLEIIVHLEFKEALKLYKAIPLKIPEDCIERLDASRLPDDWSSNPPIPATQLIGNRWMQEGGGAVLEVPSSVVPNETNFLLNPLHPAFKKIKIGEVIDLPVDPRVFEKLS